MDLQFENQDSETSYEDLWVASQGLDPEEYIRLHDEEIPLHFSADLTEATYNIPFEVLDANCDLCDEVMNDFTPWRTFQGLFRSHERDIDMSELIKSEYWSGETEIRSKRGSFMGDGLSFIHLTLLLSGLVRAVYQEEELERPLGQSVGDDLFLLNAKIKHCMKFCKYAESLGCEFSKLNSVSEDSGTFCEQYFAKISNLEIYQDLKDFENSVFGDLMFLDVIKGSLLSGNSKVKADGKSPLIGHGQMLNKQVRWNPIKDTRKRSTTFLWASNFMEAKHLGTAMASLPHMLGGIDIALGPITDFSSEKFRKEMLPYYERMLTLDLNEFLKYYILLTGIYKASPKGFAWENNWDVISPIVENSTKINITNIDDEVPTELRDKDPLAKLRYINDNLGLISFRDLADHLARQEAFYKMWNGQISKNFMTLKTSNLRQRVNHAWAIIKSNLEPTERITSRSMNELVHKFQEKSWGYYVSKEDESIADVFSGMPTMFMDVDEYHSVIGNSEHSSSDEDSDSSL